MPAKKRPKPLYQRGKFALYTREGRANLEIVWYDAERKRERSVSAGSADIAAGRLALDRLYLEDEGNRLCPTCRRPWENGGSPKILTVIADYLIKSEGKGGFGATKARLGYITAFIAATNLEMVCGAADEDWANRFRKWMSEQTPKRGGPHYSLSTIEGSLTQLAAAINALSGERAGFTPEQMKSVANSPHYRASVETIARMFDYCLNPDGRTEKEVDWRRRERASILAYLRMAVATWARPDAIFDVTSAQWNSGAGVLDLNPPGRRQTKKYRPKVPVAKQFGPLLDEMEGNWLPISVLNQPWGKMRKALGLPADREAGPKLIRRSMATLARKRIGEANWQQGRMMLGHVKADVSDVYALPDPANLGLALQVTESIIDEIIALCPGAYGHRIFTAGATKLSLVEGGKNG